MKVQLVVPLFFIFSSVVSATSGACSYHGGVDCSAGSGQYGFVICNDGTRDSTVNYSSMRECETTLDVLCPRPYNTGATSRVTCSQYKAVCDSHNAGIRNSLIVSGAARYTQGGSNAYDAATGCPDADKCYVEVGKYESLLEEYNTCVAKEKEKLQRRLDVLKVEEAEEIQVVLDNACTEKTGPSKSRNGYCYCIDGYILGSSRKCISNEEFAEENCVERDRNSTYKSGTCVCKTGYQTIKTVVRASATKSFKEAVATSAPATTAVTEGLVLTPPQAKETPKRSFWSRFRFW